MTTHVHPPGPARAPSPAGAVSLLGIALIALWLPHTARAQSPATTASCDSLSPARCFDDPAQAFVWTLPRLRCLAHAHAGPRLATEQTTQGMVEAIDRTTAELRPLLLRLVAFYPRDHFGRDGAAYVDSVVRTRGHWLWLVSQPEGAGTAGTMHRIDMALTGLGIIEDMIEEASAGLAGRDDDFPWALWRERWRRSFDLGAAPQ